MKVVAVSPHLDDAVFSVGATVHSLTRRGASVTLATVFAGDVETPGRPSYWDAKRGLDDKGGVVAARRDEDSAAAAALGADTLWLPNDDSAYPSARDPRRILDALAPALAGAALVLLPGWPLSHADHRYVTTLLIESLRGTVPLAFYVEMPYGAHPVSLVKGILRGRNSAPLVHAGLTFDWRASSTTKADWVAKRAAIKEYAGELVALGLDAKWSRWHDRYLSREVFATEASMPAPDMLFEANP